MAHRTYLAPIRRMDIWEIRADVGMQYWVVYAFFTVFESAISAVYWFPFYYTFKFVFIIWMALPQTAYVVLSPHRFIADPVTDERRSGAQVVFRSLLQPLFARFFHESRSTSEQLRSQADKASSKLQ